MGKREACDPTLVKMAEEEPVSSEATGGGRGRGGGGKGSGANMTQC